MLIEFRLENYRSFRDEQILSFVANSDDSLSDNLYEHDKLRILKSAAIYGPNASGKSNILKALDSARTIVLKSASVDPSQPLPVQPFLLDSVSGNQPTSFEFSFIAEGVRYQFGFSATSDEIHAEWLTAYPQGRIQKWYDRKRASNGEQIWEFGTFLKGMKKQLADKTRKNALFLSAAAQWNHDQLTLLYNWFKDQVRIVISETPDMATVHRLRQVDQVGFDDYLRTILSRADMGIDDFQVKTVPADEIRSASIPDNIKQDMLKDYDRHPPVAIHFRHLNQQGKNVSMNLVDESEGTQKLFWLAGPLYQALTQGVLVAYDELESSLHPLLIRELIRSFHNSAGCTVSHKCPQLLFAAHDVSLLDPELLRRDQIWFTEKDSAGASRLYPLTDYHPRKDEALQKGYLTGRYGAIPILEAFSQ